VHLPEQRAVVDEQLGGRGGALRGVQAVELRRAADHVPEEGRPRSSEELRGRAGPAEALEARLHRVAEAAQQREQGLLLRQLDEERQRHPLALRMARAGPRGVGSTGRRGFGPAAAAAARQHWDGRLATVCARTGRGARAFWRSLLPPPLPHTHSAGEPIALKERPVAPWGP
jgi:hypothetical protein